MLSLFSVQNTPNVVLAAGLCQDQLLGDLKRSPDPLALAGKMLEQREGGKTKGEPKEEREGRKERKRREGEAAHPHLSILIFFFIALISHSTCFYLCA